MHLLGDLELAEADLRIGAHQLERNGDPGHLATTLHMLGQVQLSLGHIDESLASALRARAVCPPDDVEGQAGWRGLLARIESHHGRAELADSLSREALDWIRRSDQLEFIGDRYIDRAVVLTAAGRQQEAHLALQEALNYYRSKGVVSSVRATHDMRAGL
jgi:tetratricopeptide (TPR) repeat protein